MADIYFEDATQVTSPAGDEAIPVTVDPAGTPSDGYIALDDIFLDITNLTAGTPDTAADFMPYYDASGTAVYKALIDNFIPSATNWILAWVNFNGTGTVAIRDNSGVSSITDNGTGDYTVNFSPALASANYAALVTNGGTASTLTLRTYEDSGTSRSTTQLRIVSIGVSGGNHVNADAAQISVIVVEDT